MRRQPQFAHCPNVNGMSRNSLPAPIAAATSNCFARNTAGGSVACAESVTILPSIRCRTRKRLP